MKTIYLAGFISTDYPESLSWRLIAEARFADVFHVLSPMRGKERLKSQTTDGGITTTVNTSKDIILRDWNDVKRSDVILMHLENFGSPRPLIGTVSEMAWAWQLQKPIVGIANEGNYLMRNHPFVKESVAHYLPTVEEAIDFAASFYSR